MKHFNFNVRVALVAVIVAIMMPSVAYGQFKIGPRIGLEVNSLHFNSDLFNSDNRAGFTGGLQAEFMIPAVGFGFDASLMYVRRDAKFMENNEINSAQRDYFDIPINLKYKLSIPLIASVVKPYIFTGPDFAFLTSGTRINEAWRSKKVDVAWNVGVGVEFVNHLQIGASYGIGISKAAEAIGVTSGKQEIDGKNRYWTVTAAWLF